ncbi:MAG: TRAP transporter small permease subunit [Candidatus Caldatribacteriota bacterium]|nr:TRAP transporter small permease subunit [Atribacterota bacterium]
MDSKKFNNLGNIVNFIGKIELYASILTLIIMVLLIIYSVLLRYVFHKPAIWISATITLIFIWTSMLSISYVYKKRGHISITFFIDKVLSFDKKIKKIVNILIYLIIIVNLIFVILGTIQVIPLHAGRNIIGLGISRVYLSAAILTSIVSMLITTIYFLICEIN